MLPLVPNIDPPAPRTLVVDPLDSCSPYFATAEIEGSSAALEIFFDSVLARYSALSANNWESLFKDSS